MIPKIIHYCWFDKNRSSPKPEVVQRCIASWSKFCPDYEVKLWSEDTFDVSVNSFTQEAYNAGKLGFVPDFIRAYLLYTYGGIYLDADMELLQNIDKLLINNAFSGIENVRADGSMYPGTAMLGAEKGNRWIKSIMEYYEAAHFVNPDGSLAIRETSNLIQHKITGELYGSEYLTEDKLCDSEAGGKKVVLPDVTFYSKDVLYPHDDSHIRPHTLSIHRVMASWMSPVSVVMPVYNAEKYIAESVESVLNQTFKRFELIVVNDSSTDSTVSIVNSYKDSRIVLLESTHNLVDSLNLGMRRACGKYIARMDADDVMHVERLRKQYDLMEVLPDVAVCCSWMNIMREGMPLKVMRLHNGLIETPLQKLLKGNIVAHPTTMLRKDFLIKNSLWYDRDYPYAEDYKLWTEIAKLGGKFYSINEPLLNYRYSEDQVSKKKSEEQQETSKRIKDEVLTYLQLQSAPEHAKHPTEMDDYTDSGLYNAKSTKSLVTHKPPQLTIIIPFLNEGNELQKTLQSIKDTATGNPNIILINDSSTDGYDYQGVAIAFGCTYLYHSKRIGVASSRDEGVALCKTPYFLLLDAHMEFYEQGWDDRVVDILKVNPRSLLCSRTGTITGARGVKPPVAPTFGAYFDNEKPCGINATWNRQDPNPNETLVEIPCVLGAAYVMSKDYWERLHGLRGLISYGLDESLISLKVWCEGGKCLLVKDWLVGHLYRKNAPYAISGGDMAYNEIFIIRLFFTGINREDRLLKLQKRNVATFGVAYEQIKKNADFIERERSYLWSIFTPDAEQKLTALCGRL
jgi:glycosyltransferase involved in cell wall biosynthesis